MLGMTSVTFRGMTCEEIIDLVKKSGLDGIEWGSDSHVLPGDVERAKDVAEKTEAAGLKVLSYGSYYRLGNYPDAKEEFAKYVASAKALKAPIIRIWAGAKGPEALTEEDYVAYAAECRTICAMAAEENLTVAFEYHRYTVTQTLEGTLKLLKMADCPNLKTYWQPNPDIIYREQLQEIRELLPYIVTIHTFTWVGNNIRYLMSDGVDLWTEYMTLAKPANPNYVMEFVKDDSPEIFLEDAKTLREIADSVKMFL